MSANGRLQPSELRKIPGGELAPDAAVTWIAMRSAFIAAGGNPSHFKPGGPLSSYRTFAEQEEEKRKWTAAGQPWKAATPGTSNHGLGLAVDIPWPEAQAYIMRHGADFGWSHDEGLRVGEPWHMRYVGVPESKLKKFRDQADSLRGYTAAEKRWIREYDSLNRSGRNPHRVAVLRRVMGQRALVIREIAEHHGWTVIRHRRFKSLAARAGIK